MARGSRARVFRKGYALRSFNLRTVTLSVLSAWLLCGVAVRSRLSRATVRAEKSGAPVLCGSRCEIPTESGNGPSRKTRDFHILSNRSRPPAFDTWGWIYENYSVNVGKPTINVRLRHHPRSGWPIPRPLPPWHFGPSSWSATYVWSRSLVPLLRFVFLAQPEDITHCMWSAVEAFDRERGRCTLCSFTGSIHVVVEQDLARLTALRIQAGIQEVHANPFNMYGWDTDAERAQTGEPQRPARAVAYCCTSPDGYHRQVPASFTVRVGELRSRKVVWSGNQAGCTRPAHVVANFRPQHVHLAPRLALRPLRRFLLDGRLPDRAPCTVCSALPAVELHRELGSS